MQQPVYASVSLSAYV